MKIQIKYSDEYIKRNLPKIKQLANSDWVDLYTSTDAVIKFGEVSVIPLGVSMQLPKGYEAHLVARSSLFKNYGAILTNGVGIIDESYCGNNDEWKASLLGVDKYNEVIYVPAGSRLVQFRIIRKQPDIGFIEVDDLGNPDRDGFGSTGR